MKKFINILITIIGHLLLWFLNNWFAENKGTNNFQLFSFIILHAMWQHYYISVIRKRIYGLK
jgi:hypothetical protein